jgi:ferredoxin
MMIFDNMKQSMDRFFGTPAFKLVRRDDPQTSHDAAQGIDTTNLERMVYEAIKSCPEGCISDQILRMYPEYPYSSITARYRALLDKGLIEITGVRPGRFGKNQRIMRAK